MEEENKNTEVDKFKIIRARLKPNHAGILLKHDSEKPLNYGVIRVDDDTLVYYTQVGMLKMKDDLHAGSISEEEMEKLGYIEKLKLEEIKVVLV